MSGAMLAGLGDGPCGVDQADVAERLRERLVRQAGWVIIVTMTILPIAEVKRHLSELVTRVSQQHERVVLTRNGRPAAVLISPDDLEGLEITVEVLADPEAMDRIREAEDAIERGETADAAPIRADLAARRASA
jgi:prevent-host-death family protein